jgi:D-xylose transport system substrate-binding protein
LSKDYLNKNPFQIQRYLNKKKKVLETKKEVIMKKNSLIIILLIISSIVLSSCIDKTSEQNNNDKTIEESKDTIIIGFLMSSLKTERWQKDKELFEQRAEELGAKVIFLSANDNANTQIRQAENLILQKVDVIVIVTSDSEKTAVIVEKAHQEGIKVIAYDRLIKNSELDYYVSFDNIKVGERQAQGVLDIVDKGKFAYLGGSETDNNAFLVKEGSFKVLEDKINNGEIEIVFEEFTEDWRAEVAYKNLKDFLERGGEVDAVIAANDGIAGGAIQALNEYGLAGKVPVSGQDASLGACQRIVQGTQTMTVYKPLREIANKTAEVAVLVAKEEEIKTNTFVDNGMIKVPSILLDVTAVTKDNINSTIIADSFHSIEEVYLSDKN